MPRVDADREDDLPAVSEVETAPEDALDLIPVCGTMDEQKEAVMERFRALTREAGRYGITVFVAVGLTDPIEDNNMFDYTSAGSLFAVRGLVEMAREDLIRVMD